MKGGLNVFYIQIADIIGKISKDLQPFKFKGTFAFKKNGHWWFRIVFNECYILQSLKSSIKHKKR